MTYWLVKSEPDVYPWEQLVKDKKIVWDGVRNYQARNNLQAMKKGDLVLFYHSNEDKAIIGVARVSQEAYQDPTTTDNRWVAVTLSYHQPLINIISLEEIKKQAKLREMVLVKQARLSVIPVTTNEFNIIMKLSQTKLVI